MSVEITVLAYAGILQFIQFVLMAVAVNIQLGVKYTAGNRDQQKEITGIAGRLVRALNNHFEGLILFTIVVVVTELSGASNELTQRCAWLYLISRVLYVPVYVWGIFMLRSIVWGVGFFATLVMLVSVVL